MESKAEETVSEPEAEAEEFKRKQKQRKRQPKSLSHPSTPMLKSQVSQHLEQRKG